MTYFRYQNLCSERGDLTVVILRVPADAGRLLCDGRPLTPCRPVACSSVTAGSDRAEAIVTLVDAESGLQLSCTASGRDRLTFEGRALRAAVRELVA